MNTQNTIWKLVFVFLLLAGISACSLLIPCVEPDGGDGDGGSVCAILRRDGGNGTGTASGQPDATMADASRPDVNRADAGGRDSGRPDVGSTTPEWVLDNTFETNGNGLLVTVPEGMMQKLEPLERRITDPNVRNISAPITAVRFKLESVAPAPGGNEYLIFILAKKPTETFQQWLDRSSWGDAVASTEYVTTRNGYQGVYYDTNDLGAIPYIHALIPTGNYVYDVERIDNRIPYEMSGEELIRFTDRSEFWEVPEHFLNFIRNMDVAR